MDNINVTNKNNNYVQNTLNQRGIKTGIPTNYIKYLKVNTFMQIFEIYEINDI